MGYERDQHFNIDFNDSFDKTQHELHKFIQNLMIMFLDQHIKPDQHDMR